VYNASSFKTPGIPLGTGSHACCISVKYVIHHSIDECNTISNLAWAKAKHIPLVWIWHASVGIDARANHPVKDVAQVSAKSMCQL